MVSCTRDKRGASPFSRRWCFGAAQELSPTSGDSAMSQSEKWSFLPKQHLKESLQKSTSEGDKKRLTADMHKPGAAGSDNGASDGGELSGEEIFQLGKEEEIEKRKAEVQQKVQAKLSKVENEARSLDNLRKELENLEDPTKKEVSEIRKKIEAVDKELKPLKQLCEKKEKELREATRAHEEKMKVKAALVSKLKEVVAESEAARMKKLNELSRSFEELEQQLGAITTTTPSPPVPPTTPIPTGA